METLASSLSAMTRPSPKSQILTSQARLRRRFRGFYELKRSYQVAVQNSGRMKVLQPAKNLVDEELKVVVL